MVRRFHMDKVRVSNLLKILRSYNESGSYRISINGNDFATYVPGSMEIKAPEQARHCDKYIPFGYMESWANSPSSPKREMHSARRILADGVIFYQSCFRCIPRRVEIASIGETIMIQGPNLYINTFSLTDAPH
jgi:hypothetical protein